MITGTGLNLLAITLEFHHLKAFYAAVIFGLMSIMAAPLFAQSPRQVTIGVLAYDGKPAAQKRWQPTADFLTTAIAGSDFVIRPLTQEEIRQATLKKQLDFILTHPGQYVRLEAEFGVTRLVTFKSRFSDLSLTQFGAVIITRSDSSIKTLTDLKNRSFGAVNPRAFGGRLMAQKEMELAEKGLSENIRYQWLGFPQSDIVHAVIRGDVDAGNVRTGVLERLVENGLIEENQIRVLSPRVNDDFPLQRSTELYPEWPLARTPSTDTDLAEQITVALLRIEPDSAIALSSLGAGWTIPSDYSPVHELFRFLHLYPYEKADVELGYVAEHYAEWLVIAAGFMAIALVVIWQQHKNNHDLRQSRIDLNEQHEHLEQLVNQRTRDLENLNAQLEHDKQIILNTQSEYRNACESLHVLTVTTSRQDLSHRQKLQTIVDICSQLVDAVRVVYFDYNTEMGWAACAQNTHSVDNPVADPVSVTHLDEVREKQVSVFDESISGFAGYLAIPMAVTDEHKCVIEMVFSNIDAFNQLKDDSSLNYNILTLLTRWAANELMISRELNRQQGLHHQNQQRFEALSSREHQVLQLMADGKPNKRIADELSISIKTVELHRANLLKKTESKSSIELVRLAEQSGLLN